MSAQLDLRRQLQAVEEKILSVLVLNPGEHGQVTNVELQGDDLRQLSDAIAHQMSDKGALDAGLLADRLSPKARKALAARYNAPSAGSALAELICGDRGIPPNVAFLPNFVEEHAALLRRARLLDTATALARATVANEDADSLAQKIISLVWTQPAHGLHLVPFSKIAPEPLEWLWKGLIPRGKLLVLAGRGGVGKSALATDIAARISRGASWPAGNGRFAKGDVVVLSAEDDGADTIRPRLDAAGADVQRVHLVRTDGGGFRLDRDLPKLDHALGLVESPNLVIVDPVGSHIGGVDAHKDADVRRVLDPLVQLASRRAVTILLIAHTNKSVEQAARDRVLGSVAWTNVPRQTLLAVGDPKDPDRRLLAVGKANLARDNSAVAYRLASTDEGALKVEWEEEVVDVDLEAVFAQSRGGRGQAAPELSKAVDFLRRFLANGPVQASEVFEATREAGLAKKTVDRAKGKLRIESKRRSDGWYWSLHDDQDRQDGQERNGDHLLQAGPQAPSGGLRTGHPSEMVKMVTPLGTWPSSPVDDDDEERVEWTA